MPTLVKLPAGRSFRRSSQAKWVDPQPEKGTIELSIDEGIVNLVWRNKETENAEDELLIFPGEATFERVARDPTGRSYALKFNSSNQVHFFWLQRATIGEVDARAAADIDGLLQDPSYSLGSAPIPPVATADASREAGAASVAGAAGAVAAAAVSGVGASASASASASGATATATAAAAASTGGEPAPSRDSAAHMARLLSTWAAQHLPQQEREMASLSDILTPETVSGLLTEQPQLAETLARDMPSDLVIPGISDSGSGSSNSPEAIVRVVGSPQFRDAVRNLEMALRQGMLPASTVPWLHLPDGEGGVWNLRTFLNALRGAEGAAAEDGSGEPQGSGSGAGGEHEGHMDQD